MGCRARIHAWHARARHLCAFSEAGQASLEYLLVGVALVATIAGMGALWRFVSGGELAATVDACASHALAETGGTVDALMF